MNPRLVNSHSTGHMTAFQMTFDPGVKLAAKRLTVSFLFRCSPRLLVHPLFHTSTRWNQSKKVAADGSPHKPRPLRPKEAAPPAPSLNRLSGDPPVR